MTIRQLGVLALLLTTSFTFTCFTDANLLRAETLLAGEDPIILDDDLDEIRAQFDAQLEKMRKDFREQLERLQEGPRRAVEEARGTIARLQEENRRLKRELGEMAEQVARLSSRISATDDRPRGMLGIAGIEPDDETMRRFGVKRSSSVLVTAVVEGSPADEMGLKVGDVITSLGGDEVGIEEFIETMKKRRAGDAVVISFQRSESDGILDVTSRTTLVEWNDEMASRAQRASTTPSSAPAVDIAIARPAPVEPTPAVEEPAGDRMGVRLGVSVVQDENFRLVVTEVEGGSIASTAGLQEGDIIQSFGGHRVRTIAGLRDVLGGTPSVGKTQIGFARGDQMREVALTLSGPDSASVASEAPTVTTAGDAPSSPGFLGIAPEERDGVLVVVEVVPGTCAAQIGLEVGDVIVSVDGQPVAELADLRSRMAGRQTGSSIEIKFRRGDETKTASGKLGEFPTGDQGARPTGDSRSGPSDTGNPAAAGENRLGVVVIVEEQAAIVENVLSGGVAEAAGVRVGDQILELSGERITGFSDLSAALSASDIDEGFTLEVLRSGEVIPLAVSSDPSSVVPAHFDEKVVVTDEFTSAAGEKPRSQTPFLGIEVEERAGGLTVVAVKSGAPGDTAGIHESDQLVGVAGVEVLVLEDIKNALSTISGDTFQIEVIRNGTSIILVLGVEGR